MSEISHAGGETHAGDTHHAGDESHGARSGDVPHAAIHGGDANREAVHGGYAHDAPLGPIDWLAWGAGLLGIAAAAVVAICLYVTTSL